MGRESTWFCSLHGLTHAIFSSQKELSIACTYTYTGYVYVHDSLPLFMNGNGGIHRVHLYLAVWRPPEARFMSAFACVVGIAYS